MTDTFRHLLKIKRSGRRWAWSCSCLHEEWSDGYATEDGARGVWLNHRAAALGVEDVDLVMTEVHAVEMVERYQRLLGRLGRM